MGKEIVINAEKEQTRIAILENGELVELYIENPDNARTIGDVYLGRVKKIMPSIQAAFVDIGQKQDAFLHFSDLADNLPQLLEFVESPNPHVGPDTATQPHRSRGKRRKPMGTKGASVEHEASDEGERKHRQKPDPRERGRRRSAQRHSHRGAAPGERRDRSDDVRQETFLQRDKKILVKVVKEPISNKGSRVSTDISLAGRFLVLVPFANYIAVSKKIYSYKERRRLRALAKSLVPEGFGLIVRTVADGKNAKTLDTDLNLLLDKWRKIEKNLANSPTPPVVVHQDVNMVSSVMRDLFTDDYDRVLIDDERLYRNIKNYIQAIAPQMVKAVQFHKNKRHVFEAARIDTDIQEAFSGRVNLPSGGYLFIEHTEAMHVIDVNSGRSGRGLSQEENSLRVNIESARAIAKQIRLRDLGGIIVIDFIDLRDERNKKKVYDEMKKEFRKDRAVSKILPMSDFGLMQITRQRLRPSVTVNPSGNYLPKNGSPTTPKEPQKAEEPISAPPERKHVEPVLLEKKPQAGHPEELVREMEQWLIDYKTLGNRRPVTLRVHPFTAAYLNRKVPNHPTRWFMKHLIRVRLEPDDAVSPLAFRFVDSKSGEDLTEKVTVPGA